MKEIFVIFALWIVGSSYPMIRSKSIAPSTFSLIDTTKKIDDMTKFSTTSEFIAKASKKHPDIDFGKVKYVSAITHVLLVCKKCGLEWNATPNGILNGNGCPHCSKTSLILGIGINDVPLPTRNGNERDKAYRIWKSMLERCYSVKYHQREPSYIGCSVCEDWAYFSNFKVWFDNNYIDGYALDKDILIKGNKIYSPDTCCFVPREINNLISKLVVSYRKNGFIGVHIDKRCSKNKYVAILSKNGKNCEIGRYQSKKEAFLAYKSAKELHIQEIATKYFKEGKITERVYNALMNYKV